MKAFKTDCVLCLSNWGGIELMLNDSCDAATYKWYGKPSNRWQQIKYTNAGDPYVVIKGRRFKLDEFMRV